MTKAEFLVAAGAYLKPLGYKKNRNYWFQANGEIVRCVYVQGSQWDSDDYYVEVGVALQAEAGERPSLTRWYVRSRCTSGKNGDANPDLSALISSMSFLKEISSVDELNRYMNAHRHIAIGLQYELY